MLPSQIKLLLAGTLATSGRLEVSVIGIPAFVCCTAAESFRYRYARCTEPLIVRAGVTHWMVAPVITTMGGGDE